MEPKYDKPCKCDKPKQGFYYKNSGDENKCECGKSEPHRHCLKCGGISQVS